MNSNNYGAAMIFNLPEFGILQQSFFTVSATYLFFFQLHFKFFTYWSEVMRNLALIYILYDVSVEIGILFFS
jgi:ABC-type proline/glycine betaine transport system permease subunit